MASKTGGAGDMPEAARSIVPCFARGTLIATAGGELPIEDLREGELAVTASGAARPIRWIGRQGGGDPARTMCIKAGALGDGVPARDLHVPSGHALYLGGLLIPVDALVNHVSILPADPLRRLEHFHIMLDTHDVIFAEGAPAETFLNLADSGGAMDATGEYAPRVVHGAALEAIRYRLDKRAGLYDGPARPGPLQGALDEASPLRIAGWAQDRDHPEAAVALTLVANGKVLRRLIANRYRPDLAEARLGSGYHAFEYIPDTPLDHATLATVTLFRSTDGADLPGLAEACAA